MYATAPTRRAPGTIVASTTPRPIAGFPASPLHCQADGARRVRARFGARGTNIRIRFDRQSRISLAIAGAGLFAFAVVVFATALRSGSDVPGEATESAPPPEIAAPLRDSGKASGAQAGVEPPGTPLAPARRNARAACRECGVIESTRQVEAPLLGDGLGHIEVWMMWTQSHGASGKPTVAPALRDGQFETMVRLRNGSTALVTEATPRDWRAGSRVIVIDGMRVRDD